MQALSRHQDRTRRVSDPAHTLEVTGVRSEDPACTRILCEARRRKPPPLVLARDLPKMFPEKPAFRPSYMSRPHVPTAILDAKGSFIHNPQLKRQNEPKTKQASRSASQVVVPGRAHRLEGSGEAGTTGRVDV